MSIIEVTNTLCLQEETRLWCLLPYPGHPFGCPNYGVSIKCPPQVCFVKNFMNLFMKSYFIIERFNLKEHTLRMALLHPTWSEKQCKCCLYWQNTVRKKLRQQCIDFIKQHPTYIYTLIPEAMGVNVFRTAHRNGIMLKKNPDIVYKIALAGEKL